MTKYYCTKCEALYETPPWQKEKYSTIKNGIIETHEGAYCHPCEKTMISLPNKKRADEQKG